MENSEKLKIFEKYLNKIKTKFIKDFAKKSILSLPEYFWILSASSSGKHHGENETLIDHVLACCYLATKVHEQMSHKDQIWKDQLLATMILHDGWRCGFPGKEERFSKKIIKEKGYNDELEGKLMTSKEHPYVAYQMLINSVNESLGLNIDELIVLGDIAIAVGHHMGRWKEPDVMNKLLEFDSKMSYDDLNIQAHNIDFMQTMSSQANRKGK